MSVLADLAIQLSVDNTGIDQGLEESESKVKQWSKRLGEMGRTLTAGLTMPIVAGFGLAINQASGLAEAVSANEAVYGENSKAIQAWADTAAQAFGLSKAEALTATNQMGQLFKGMGMTADEAAGFSQEMVKAAADLGSFNDVDPSVMLDAIRAGLVGEVEPLRRFGIMLDAATVEAKAMEMGLADANGEISEGAKVKAREALIMEQLGDANGDFARTQDGVANSTRILKAQIKDLAAKFGMALLPRVAKMMKVGKKLLTWIQGTSGNTKKLIVAFALFAAAIGPVLIGLSMLLPALALLASPIGLIVLALAALGTAYALNLFGFRDAVNSVAGVLWDFIKPVVAFGKALLDAFTSGKPVNDLVAGLPAPIRSVARGFLLIADAIGDLIKRWKSGGFGAMLDLLPKKLRQIWKGAKAIGQGILDNLGNIAGGIAAWFAGQIAQVDWDGVWDRLVDIGVVILNGSLKLGEFLYKISLNFGDWFWGELKRDWDNVVRIQGPVTLAFDGLMILPGFKDMLIKRLTLDAIAGITLFASRIATLLIPVGSSVAEGLFNTLLTNAPRISGTMYTILVRVGKTAFAGLVKGLTSGATKKILDGINNPTKLGIDQAMARLMPYIERSGERMIGGFAHGIELRFRSVQSWFRNMPGTIADLLVNIGETLMTRGRQLINGLWTGAIGRFVDVSEWAKGLPGDIARFVGSGLTDAASDLSDQGEDIINKVKSGMGTAFDGGIGGGASLLSWVAGIPGKIAGQIAGAVANAYNALFNAGWAVIKAFWDGISGAWNNLIPDMFKGIIGAAGISLGAGASMSMTSPAPVSVSGFSGASGSGGVTIQGDINITVPGYNQSPDALAAAIARVLGQDIALTIGATG